MTVTIGSNVISQQAQRRVLEGSTELSRVFERLSSGQRINRASDDAAGLAVSSILNNQSRVFGQAIRNVNDGISVVNIADGALNELSSILQRGQELATQSANGVYSDKQRSALDTEFQGLISEYNRVLATTKFNGVQLFTNSQNVMSIEVGEGTLGGIDVTTGQYVAQIAGQTRGMFGANSIYAQNSDPENFHIDDVNGDGTQDLLVLESGAGTLSVRLGNGDGTFGAGTTYAVGGNKYWIEVGDINSDHILDVMTLGIGGGDVTILLGNQGGTFKAATTFLSTLGSLWGSALSDFNSDSRPDLVVAERNSGTVEIELGQGNGTFSAGQTVSSGGARDVTAADFNNDGKLDFAVGTEYALGFTAFLGNGDGNFSVGTFWAMDSVPVQVSFADLNGDGNLDAVGPQLGGTGVSVLLGNGNGTFRATQSYNIGYASGAVALGDINGDGYVDAVSDIFNGADQLSVIFGNGDGSFKAVTHYTMGTGVQNPQLADLNGDSLLDVVSVNFTDNNLSVRLQIPTLTVSSVVLARQAITRLTSLSDGISSERANLGATQNRLNVAQASLSTAKVNYLNAATRITDADIGQETAALERGKILQQASVAILAQANLLPQIALSLISG